MQRPSKDIRATRLCYTDSMNCVGIDYLYDNAQVYIVLGGRDSPMPQPIFLPVRMLFCSLSSGVE